MQPITAINRQTLFQMLEDLGDDVLDVFNQLIELFLADTPQLLETLKGAVGRNDFEEAKRVAHRLKGGCAQMGALALAHDAELAEGFCAACDHAQMQHVIETMELNWRQIVGELSALRELAARSDGSQAFLNSLSDRGAR